MLDLSLVEAAQKFCQGGDPVAFAIVMATWGSAPVPAGGMMAIAADGRFAGSVSGGCIEADVIAEALQSCQDGQRRVLDFGIADETAWRAGLACGGRIRLLVEPLTASAAVNYLDRLTAAAGLRRAAVERIPLDASGTRHLATADDGAMPAEMRQALARRKPEIAVIDGTETFINVHLPAARLLIIGATHIAQHLATMARMAGFAVTVIDPREAFTAGGRFDEMPTATQWPERALAELGLDAHTAVVTLTHVGHIDDEALAIALRSNSPYIGALGSKKTHARRIERLHQAGFGEHETRRIRAPVGLDIGAMTPPEIAVSILAEVISVLRKPERP